MQLSTLVPYLVGLHLHQIVVEDNVLILVVRASRRTAACPLCQRLSARIHSSYQRSLVDLPWGERPVRLRLAVRRFRCLNRRCRRRIFAERFAHLTSAYARRTQAQRIGLEDFGFAAGGSAGARLAKRRGLIGSRATILRFLHATPLPRAETPCVLGVDDWARKRGRTYGTILVDLETHRVIDLLEERTADVLATWLREHPGVQIIARDRGGAYADGARQGAPDAIQVADRFHLVANAGDALERVLARKHQALRTAAMTVDREKGMVDKAGPAEIPGATVAPAAQHLTKQAQRTLDRRARRQARYEEVIGLSEQGMGIRAIGRQVQVSRKTVARYVRAGGFPDRAPRPPRRSILSLYETSLRERWAEGCHNAHTLWEEIRAQGFSGAASLVRVHVAAWRTKPARRGRDAGHLDPTREGALRPPPTHVRSPRQARWLLLHCFETLTGEEKAYRTALLEDCSEVQAARDLIEEFGRLVRERGQAALAGWLARATDSGIAELREFAGGIRRDQAAVEAALSLEWSNGQTEGQINRLKFLKRQMYGKASFALLKRRVLAAA